MTNSILVPDDPMPGDMVRSEDGISIGVVVEDMGDGRVKVNMDNGHLANIRYKWSGPANCDCGSEKVYYDLEDEWVCPFCEL